MTLHFTLVSSRNLSKGTKIIKKYIEIKRPGTGNFTAKDSKKILNKKLKLNIKKIHNSNMSISIKRKLFSLLVQEQIMENLNQLF